MWRGTQGFRQEVRDSHSPIPHPRSFLLSHSSSSICFSFPCPILVPSLHVPPLKNFFFCHHSHSSSFLSFFFFAFHPDRGRYLIACISISLLLIFLFNTPVGFGESLFLDFFLLLLETIAYLAFFFCGIFLQTELQSLLLRNTVVSFFLSPNNCQLLSYQPKGERHLHTANPRATHNLSPLYFGGRSARVDIKLKYLPEVLFLFLLVRAFVWTDVSILINIRGIGVQWFPY